MIKSFRDRACQRLWMGEFVKRFSGIEKQALRNLDMLHTARNINDLRAPPANRLEALTGDRRGQHTIRINNQWRICFIWTEEGPADVEIVDYHKSYCDPQPGYHPSRRGTRRGISQASGMSINALGIDLRFGVTHRPIVKGDRR